MAGAVDVWMGGRAAEGGRRAAHDWCLLLASLRYVNLKSLCCCCLVAWGAAGHSLMESPGGER